MSGLTQQSDIIPESEEITAAAKARLARKISERYKKETPTFRGKLNTDDTIQDQQQIILVKDEIILKDEDDSLCVRDHTIDTYLKFTGRVHQQNWNKILQFDRNLLFTAKNSVLHVNGKDIDVKFDIGVVVSDKYLKYQTNVSQIVEHPVYLNLEKGLNVKILSGSFIIAIENYIFTGRISEDYNTIEEAAHLIKESSYRSNKFGVFKFESK